MRRLTPAVPLFDHHIGAQQDRRRECDAEGLGYLEVDYQLKFGRLLYRQIGGLLALEDATDIAACPALHVRDVGSVGHQAACLDTAAHRA